MSVNVFGEYLGNLRVKMVHEPSGADIATVAPVDNNGDGSLFSPTDLVGAALGSCVMTVMGIVAQRDGVDLTGMSMHVEKRMITAPVRQIGTLNVIISVPASVPEGYRAKLENTGRTCPVKNSIKDGIVNLEFKYV
jgi:putative redox protein